jgi:hypothetical protein
MSEFKFACPVCGQHITADSSTSGGQLECPTCFQKIVIPQAPGSGDNKFILSAAQVGKPRPTPTELQGSSGPKHLPPKAIPIAAITLCLLLAAGGAAFVFRDKIFKSIHVSDGSGSTKKAAEKAPIVVYPIPTNVAWTLDITNVEIPDSPAVGSIHSNGFYCERSTLQGGTLTLRQGKSWPPDVGVTIQLVAKQGEELSGKTVEIPADRPPPVPHVILRWKDEQREPITHNVNNGGYALKVIFGDAANGRMPGKLYLSLPDDEKSFVAGTFDAEIRRANPPKKKAPKQPQPAAPKQ